MKAISSLLLAIMLLASATPDAHGFRRYSLRHGDKAHDAPPAGSWHGPTAGSFRGDQAGSVVPLPRGTIDLDGSHAAGDKPTPHGRTHGMTGSQDHHGPPHAGFHRHGAPSFSGSGSLELPPLSHSGSGPTVAEEKSGERPQHGKGDHPQDRHGPRGPSSRSFGSGLDDIRPIDTGSHQGDRHGFGPQVGHSDKPEN